jgi:hypothetical protein
MFRFREGGAKHRVSPREQHRVFAGVAKVRPGAAIQGATSRVSFVLAEANTHLTFSDARRARMNDPAKHRQVPRKQDRDNELMFWYWLPVVGAAVGLTFVVLERWLGS